MQKSTPFARARAMMAAIGPYESRGKGEGRSNRRPAGAHKAAHRAAAKARRVRAHRAHA